MSKENFKNVNFNELSSNPAIQEKIKEHMSKMQSFTFMFAIYDDEVQNVDRCFFAKNETMAKRFVFSVVNDQHCPYRDFLDKYSLICMGQYSDKDAVLIPDDRPIIERRVGLLSEYLRKE